VNSAYLRIDESVQLGGAVSLSGRDTPITRSKR
jgi:hypothetical protein